MVRRAPQQHAETGRWVRATIAADTLRAFDQRFHTVGFMTDQLCNARAESASRRFCHVQINPCPAGGGFLNQELGTHKKGHQRLK